MSVIKTTKIDWLNSMSRLSLGAFYLLNVLYRYELKVASDDTLREITGLGLSSHRKHKKELMDIGYLQVNQVGRGIYRYTIGDLDG